MNEPTNQESCRGSLYSLADKRATYWPPQRVRHALMGEPSSACVDVQLAHDVVSYPARNVHASCKASNVNVIPGPAYQYTTTSVEYRTTVVNGRRVEFISTFPTDYGTMSRATYYRISGGCVGRNMRKASSCKGRNDDMR